MTAIVMAGAHDPAASVAKAAAAAAAAAGLLRSRERETGRFIPARYRASAVGQLSGRIICRHATAAHCQHNNELDCSGTCGRCVALLINSCSISVCFALNTTIRVYYYYVTRHSPVKIDGSAFVIWYLCSMQLRHKATPRALAHG